MKCPYCGKEMEYGWIRTENGPGLFFMPPDKSYGIFPTKHKVEKAGGIVLDGPYHTRFHENSVWASVCKECRKIVVSYE